LVKAICDRLADKMSRRWMFREMVFRRRGWESTTYHQGGSHRK
jgi:hypothetical protein